MRMGIVVSGTDERLERLTDMLKETGAEVCKAQSPKDFEGREIFIGKYPFDALAAGGIARMKKGAKLIVLPAAFVTAFVLKWPPEAVFFVLKSDQIVKCAVAFIKVNSFNWILNLRQSSSEE